MLGQALTDAGEIEAAKPLLEQALAIGRRLGDQFALSWSLYRLGLAERAHDQARAKQLHTECLRVAGAQGNLAVAILTLIQLCQAALQGGSESHARWCFEEGLRMNAELQDPLRSAALLASLGEVERRSGRDAEAQTQLSTALSILRDVRDPRFTALALYSLARLSLARNELTAAREQAEELVCVRRASGPARLV